MTVKEYTMRLGEIHHGRIRGCTAAMSMLSLALASATVATGPVVHADPVCPTLYVVAIPGTWETSSDSPGKLRTGMLSQVTDELSDSIRTDFVNYSATAFPWEKEVYGRSRDEAVGNARNLISTMVQQCNTTRIALLGYSQGADAAGDLAAEIGGGRSVVSPDRVAAVGLISDPQRSPNDTLIGPPTAGQGIEGPRIGGFGAVAARTRTICATGDLYCSTPDKDFITRIAGLFAQISDMNPANFGQYQSEAESLLADIGAAGGISQLQSQLSGSADKLRVQQLETFYRSHVHASYPRYYVDSNHTATTWLHNWLADIT
ncbi:cutinase family protein [Nocardia terpenica]|uniref:cutinase family protein n=1 Tax=Nocardia terpenica TaxID=455432 RepID=UPI0028162EF2|nr:cutinase family protein [Nocardia terpenica]